MAASGSVSLGIIIIIRWSGNKTIEKDFTLPDLQKVLWVRRKICKTKCHFLLLQPKTIKAITIRRFQSTAYRVDDGRKSWSRCHTQRKEKTAIEYIQERRRYPRDSWINYIVTLTTKPSCYAKWCAASIYRQQPWNVSEIAPMHNIIESTRIIRLLSLPCIISARGKRMKVDDR